MLDVQFISYLSKIVQGVSPKGVEAVIEMHNEGATVPFMARYRKERTGNMDEVQLRAIIDSFETYNEIVKRKAFLLKEISEQGNLTAEITLRIEKSWDLGELEEIYKPFKKKKKTKATLAREAGLEPFAQWLWDVGHGLTPEDPTMEVKAKEFLNLRQGLASYDLVLKSAQDIVIEKLANLVELRDKVVNEFFERGKVTSKRAKGFKPHSKYETYQEFESSIKSLKDAKASHRYLAMRRGWQDEELIVDIVADEDYLLSLYESFATTLPLSPVGTYLKAAAKAALTVYVIPSVKNEVHRILKETADEHAIFVFAENVRKVLLSSPFGPKVTIGVDPGIRTGCKVALVDKGGNYLSHTVIKIEGEKAEAQALTLFGELFKQLSIDGIAVGNGTNGRETEIFMRKIVKDLGQQHIPVIMVNESGASVYSASDVAREEFPDLDVTVRGAISIARRLQDPLSELVKIDPKSIGVGQYQHDVNPSALKKSLHAVVESCVNLVGVDLNTASVELLSYVAGIGPSLAKNIVEFRKNKLFEDRTELMSVTRFSQKVFEQSAGFLRIPNGKASLDSTGIHPERYQAVRDMAKDVGLSLKEIVGPEGAKKIASLRAKFSPIIGEYTFDDIVKELEKPGRDPRDLFKTFSFRDDIFNVKDLKNDMICPGIVTNVTNFGAFVDIGVHQDGLVHISELSHEFITDPRSVVNPGDHVTIKVLAVDHEKSQISLTMKLQAKTEEHSYKPRQQEQQRQAQSQAQGAEARKSFTPSEKKYPKGNYSPQNARPPQAPLGEQKPSGYKKQTGFQKSASGEGFKAPSQQGNQKPPSSGNTGGARPTKPFNNPFAGLALKK